MSVTLPTMSDEHGKPAGETVIGDGAVVCLPIDALAGSGLRPGHQISVEVCGPGLLRLVRKVDPRIDSIADLIIHRVRQA